MNQVIMLRETEPRKLLQAVVDKTIAVFMSYLSGGRWHVAKVFLTGIVDESFYLEVSSQKRGCPIEIHNEQTVGMSFKIVVGSGYNNFVFGTRVVGFEKSANTGVTKIVLAIPEEIEIVQKRSYFRITVPDSLSVDVELWHRSYVGGDSKTVIAEACQGWRGKLVDISAGGMQVAVETSQGPELKRGQFVGVRFTPLHYETVLTFNAYIGSVSPTANGENVCFGLQMVGLEASVYVGDSHWPMTYSASA